MLVKAAMSGALGEVLRDRDGHIVKYKHLYEKRRTVLLSEERGRYRMATPLQLESFILF